MAPTAAFALGADSAVAAGPGPITTLGTTRHITIYAERLASGEHGYALAPGKAPIPGPPLVMWEGDTLQLAPVTTAGQRLPMHPHGGDFDTQSAGRPCDA